MCDNGIDNMDTSDLGGGSLKYILNIIAKKMFFYGTINLINIKIIRVMGCASLMVKNRME